MSLEKRISLCINSFPRTGNTFLQQSIGKIIQKNQIENIDFMSHNHDSLLLLEDINQISVIRNPLETITSLVLMYLGPNNPTLRDKVLSDINNFIDTQLGFYTDFLTNMVLSKNIVVIDFNYLIKNDINEICKSIFDRFEIPSSGLVYLSEKDISANVDANKNKHSDNPYVLNYPKDYSLLENRGQILQVVESSPYYSLAFNQYELCLDYFKNNKDFVIGEIYSSRT